MMIVYEARWLSVLPILVSVGLGYLFSYGVLAAYSDQKQPGEPSGTRESRKPLRPTGKRKLEQSFFEKISKASNPEKVLWIPWKYFCKLHGG